jgi:hypothetical protein
MKNLIIFGVMLITTMACSGPRLLTKSGWYTISEVQPRSYGCAVKFNGYDKYYPLPVDTLVPGDKVWMIAVDRF